MHVNAGALSGGFGTHDWPTVIGSSSFGSNTWVFGVQSWDSTNVYLYRDGVLEYNQARSGDAMVTLMSFAGARADNGGVMTFYGDVGMAFYSDATFSTGAVAELYLYTHPTNYTRISQ